MRARGKIPLLPTGGWARKARCHMGKFVKALTVAAMLAVALLATGSSASADGGNGKGRPALPAPAPLSITWESAPGGGFGLLGITWE